MATIVKRCFSTAPDFQTIKLPAPPMISKLEAHKLWDRSKPLPDVPPKKKKETDFHSYHKILDRVDRGKSSGQDDVVDIPIKKRKYISYKCEKCEKVFSKKMDFYQHEKSEHPKETAYRCDFCGPSMPPFNNKKSLQ